MKNLKEFAVFTMILWVMVLAGCGLSFKDGALQIVADATMNTLAKKPINNLAEHVIKHHPEDVQKYIRYCDMILTCTDKDQQISYIDIGMNTLLARNDGNSDLIEWLMQIKTIIDTDPQTSAIDFDRGSFRIALKAVSLFKDALEDGII